MATGLLTLSMLDKKDNAPIATATGLYGLIKNKLTLYLRPYLSPK